MKSGVLMWINVMLLLVFGLPIQLAAQSVGGAVMQPLQLAAQYTAYKVIVLDTFGGPQSFVSINGLYFADVKGAYLRVLNEHGAVAGTAETDRPDPGFCFADCFLAHALRWQHGTITDLGTLPSNENSGASAISANGLIAGVSENPDEIDPILGLPEFRSVLWEHGKITPLGALTEEGGYASVATGVNSHGQVIGFAFNATTDPYDLQGVGFQTRAFLWQNGVMQDLGTLGGPDAQALAINEQGQVVGDSYLNFTKSDFCADVFHHPLTTGAFIWENGVMRDLGNLGGTCTFVTALNNHGQATGASAVAGDQALHPFLWERGAIKDLGTFGGNFGQAQALNQAGAVVGWAYYPGDQVLRAALWHNQQIKDLGTLSGDSYSVAVDINAHGQVIGWSANSDFSRVRAFLWQEGHPMLDLDKLVAESGLQLAFGVANVNDRQEIVGDAIDASGNLHAVLLVPCDGTPLTDYCSANLGTSAVTTTSQIFIDSGKLPSSWRRHIPSALRTRLGLSQSPSIRNRN